MSNGLNKSVGAEMPGMDEVLGQGSISPVTALTPEETARITKGGGYDPLSVYTGGMEIPKSYERILGEGMYHPELGPEVTAEKLAAQQTAGGQFINMLNQAVIGEMFGGTIEGIGYLGDLNDAAGIIDDTEQEYGNWLSDIGKGIKEWTREVSPVYEDPSAPKFNPSSWAWWMSNAPSVASTVSLMIPAAGAIRGVSALGKMLNIGTQMGKTAKWMATGIGQAVTSRHMENMMEASGVWEESYAESKYALSNLYAKEIEEETNDSPQNAKNIQNRWKDKIETEAKQMASEGAANTYKKQWILLLQDIPQYLLLNKIFPGKKGGTVTNANRANDVSKALGVDMNKMFVNRVRSVALDMVGEGGEEMYQFLINEQSKMVAQNRIDPTTKNSLWDVFKGSYDDGELWTAATFGALGAGFMQTAGRGINKAIMSSKHKDVLDSQIKDIKTWGAIYNQAAKTYKVALEKGDPVEKAEAWDNLIFSIGIKSKIHGDPEAAKVFIEGMAKDDNDEFLNTHNIDVEYQGLLRDNSEIKDSILEDIDRVSDLHDVYLAKAKNIDGLKDSQHKQNVYAFNMTQNQFVKEKIENRLEESAARVEETKSNIPNFFKLSPEGQVITEIEYGLLGVKKITAGLIKSIDSSKKDKNYDNFSQKQLFNILDKALESKKDSFGKGEYSFYLETITDQKEKVSKLKNDLSSSKKDRTAKNKKEDGKKVLESKALTAYFRAKTKHVGLEMALDHLDNQMDGYEEAEGIDEDIVDEVTDTGEEEAAEEARAKGEVSQKKGDFSIGDVIQYEDEAGNIRFGKIENIQDELPIIDSDVSKQQDVLIGQLNEVLANTKDVNENRANEIKDSYAKIDEQNKLPKLSITEKGETVQLTDKEKKDNVLLEEKIKTEKIDTYNKIEEKYESELDELSKQEKKIRTEINKLNEQRKDVKPETVGESKFAIKPLDEDGEFTDEDMLIKSANEMSVSEKTENLEGYQDVEETYSEQDELFSGLKERETDDVEKTKGFKDPTNSLSWFKTEKGTGKLVILNHELNEIASDPTVDWSKVEARYYLSPEDGYTVEDMKKFRKELGPDKMKLWVKFKSGTPLTSNEAITLTAFSTKPGFDKFVDQISIHVELRGLPGKPYTDELKIHASDYDKIKRIGKGLTGTKEEQDAYVINKKHNARKVRITILKAILKGENPYSTGITVGRGSPRTMDKAIPKKNRKKNIATQLGVEPNAIKLGVSKSTLARKDRYYKGTQVFIDAKNPDKKIKNIINPSMVFALIDATISGDRYALKVNKARITADHASILLAGMISLGRSTVRYNLETGKYVKRKQTLWQKRRGTVGIYETPFTDNRVDNLSSGEVVDLLAVTGKPITDPNDSRFKRVVFSKDHKEVLENKRLYLEEDVVENTTYLHYGKDPSNEGRPYKIDIRKGSEIEKWHDHFVKWATENKNYAIHLGNSRLRQTLNGNFLNGRVFRIGLKGRVGSMRRERADTYAGFIIKHNLITTDAELGENDLLFHGPNIDLNIVGDKENVAKIYDGNNRPKIEEKVVREQEAKVEEKIGYSNQFNSPTNRRIIRYENDTETKFNLAEELAQIKKWSEQIESYIEEGDKTPMGIVEAITKPSTDISIHMGLKGIKANRGLLNHLKMRFEGSTNRTLLDEYRYGKTLEANETGNSTEELHPLGQDIEDDITEDQKKAIVKKPKKKRTRITKDKDERDINDIADEWLREDDIDDSVLGRAIEDNKITWEVQDKKKEIQWIEKKVNIEKVDVTKRVVNLVRNGKRNFALYTHASILLYEGAEIGTLYHEAFHRVSLGYLTPVERVRFYREARQIYKMPVDKYTDRQVEEVLAEEFRDYVLARQKREEVKQHSFLKKIFTDFYNFIKALFIRISGIPSVTHNDIDRLYAQIYSGRFRFSKVLKENLNNIGPNEYTKVWRGESYETIVTRSQMTDIVKMLTSKLISLNNVEDINNIGDMLSRDNNPWEKVISYLEDRIESGEAILKSKKLSESKLDIVEKRTLLYKELLGEKNEEGLYLKFSIIIGLVDDHLSFLGIRRLYSGDFVEEDERVGRPDNDYDKVSYQTSAKDNAMSSVKFAISTLRQSHKIDHLTGFRPFVNFGEVWERLMFELHDSISIEYMIDQLRYHASLPENDLPYYTELADKLENADENFQKQFLTTFRKHKHDFRDMLFNTQKDKITYGIISSGYNELKNYSAKIWNENLVRDTDISKFTLEERVFNEKFFDKLSKDFQNLWDNIEIATEEGTLTEEFVVNNLEELSKLLFKLHIEIDISTLRHYVEQFNLEELSGRLNSAYTDLQELISSNVFKTPLINNPVTLSLASSFAEVHPEKANNVVLGPEGNNHYIYSQHSLATEVVERINNDQDYVNERANRIYNRHSLVWRSIKTAPNSSDKTIEKARKKREAIGLATLNVVKRALPGDPGRGFLDIPNVEDYLMKQSAIQNGLLPFPTMADRKTYFFLTGVETLSETIIDSKKDTTVTFSDEVLDIFYNYYLDEVERIKEARKVLKEYNRATGEEKELLKKDLIKNYHYSGNYNLSGGNAFSFIHFKGFKYDIGKEEFYIKIQEVLNDRLQDELNYAASIGIINRRGDSISNKWLNEGRIDDFKDDENFPTNFGILNVMANHLINNQISVLESEKLFLGDPALFKETKDSRHDVSEDEYKRWFGAASSGEKMSVDLKDEESTYNNAVLNTQKFESLYYNTILEKQIELYKRLARSRKPDEKEEVLERNARALAEQYLFNLTNVDPTDGQVLISSDMYRSIARRLGQWPEDGEKQKAFDLLQSDKELTAEEELSAMNIVFNPYKTMYMGHHNHNEIDLLIYDKMSMATIFRRQVKGTHMEEVLDRMELKGKYSKDIKGNEHLERIDAFKFDTAVKVGSTFGIDMFEDGNKRTKIANLSGAKIIKQSFDNLRYQPVSDVHDIEKRPFGTQVWKIASSNIHMDESYEGFETGRELVNALTSSRIALSDIGRHNVNSLLDVKNGIVSNKRLMSLLYRDAGKAGKSEDFREALKTSEVTGEQYLELDSFPDKKWMYSRIINLINSYTIDLNLPGNQLVQVSDYGQSSVSYAAELDYSYSKKGNTKVFEMEAKVSISLFRQFIPNYNKLTFEQKKAYIEKNINILGYRIPTQGQNSVVKLKIAKLLPEQAGDIIQLPLEFTALTGSDFDIDKLFVATHHYKVKKGKLSKVTFKTDENSKVKERYNEKTWELYNIYQGSSSMFTEENAPNLYKHGIRFGRKKDIARKKFIGFDYYRANDVKIGVKYDELRMAEKSYDEAKTSEEKAKWDVIVSDIYSDIGAMEQFELSENEVDKLFNNLNKIEKEHILKEITSILINNNILSTLGDFSKQSIEAQNTRKANENRILDIFFSILSDEKHYLSTSTPLGGLTDVLIKKADLFNLYSKRKDRKNLPALRTTTPSFQTDIKERFSTLSFGIGPNALANAHVALAQQSGLKRKTFVDYGVNDKDGHLPLDSILGLDGLPITDWLSVLIDAHVDGVTNPYIIDLNVNEATYDINVLLIRAGFGEVSFDFISQPIVKTYSKLFNNANVFNKDSNQSGEALMKTSLINTREMWLNELLDILRTEKEKQGKTEEQIELELNEYVESASYVKPLSDILKNPSQLQEDIKENENKAYYERQLSVIYHFESMLYDASALKKLVLASRIDNKKFGTTPLELFNYIVNLKEIETDNKWVNLDKLISSDGVHSKEGTMLSTLLKNSVLFTRDLLKHKSIYSTYGFTSIFYDILNSTPNGRNSSKAVINTITEEMGSYFASLFFSDKVNGIGMNFEKLKNLMFDEELSIFAKLSELKDPNNKYNKELKGNVFFDALMIDFREGGPFFDSDSSELSLFLRLPYHTLYDKLQSDDYIDDFRELFNHENKAIRGFARLLYVYSFYTSGFRNRMFSYSGLIPSSTQKELEIIDPNDISKVKPASFNVHIKRIVKELSTDESIIKYLLDTKREVFQNNWWEEGLVPQIITGKVKKVYTDISGDYDMAYEVDISTASNNCLGFNTDEQLVYSPYLLMKETEGESVLLEFTAYNGTTNNPVYRIIPKKGIQQKGVVLKEYGLKSTKSILRINNPGKIYTHDQVIQTVKKGDDIIIDMPLENQIVAKKSIEKDDFFITDQASLMRELEEGFVKPGIGKRQAMKAEPGTLLHITRIISGLQSGIDETAIDLAVSFNYVTGGYVTPDYKQEKGLVVKDKAEKYGIKGVTEKQIKEFKERYPRDAYKAYYLVRTELNVINSDATVYLHPNLRKSAGFHSTRRYAKEHNKPFYIYLPETDRVKGPKLESNELVFTTGEELRQLLVNDQVKTLNVAGSRKSKMTEIEFQELKTILSDAIDPFQTPEEKQEELDQIKHETKKTHSISSPEKRLEIYVDGSDIKGTGQIGSGIHMKYNGKGYNMSSVANKSDYKDKYGLSEKELVNAVSNPTMELAATVHALGLFKNTSEHLKIIQDYNGVEKWLTKEWKAKKPWISDLVSEGLELIKNIEARGGSVKFKWMPGHIDSNKVAENKEVFKNEKGVVDQNIVDELKRGNDIADINAKSTEVSSTFGSFMELLIKPKEQVLLKIQHKIPMNFKDGTGGRRMRSEFKGKSTMDLILSGDRTATSRDMSKSYNQYDLRIGDVIQFYNKEGQTANVRITNLPESLDELSIDIESLTIEEERMFDKLNPTKEEKQQMKNIRAERWSKLEGWSEQQYHELVKKGSYEQFQFELVGKGKGLPIQQAFDFGTEEREAGKDQADKC